MSLSSFSFICYFLCFFIVIVFLQLFRKRHVAVAKIQLFLILAFSYFYIYKSDFKFCLCILIITALSFFIAILLEKTHNRIFLICGIVVLLGVLAYFKYAEFFINSFRQLLGRDSVTLDIILPIGISFYVFSAIAYLVDVYREDYKAERNIVSFSLYIAFFPKLMAGPIVRGNDFFPQIKNYRGIDIRAFEAGIQIFVFGLFKKLVLADHLGVFVDDVFFAPTAYNTGTVLLAVVSYSLQIYFDFSGYSDMAIGISKMIGFDFKPNFNLPYIAQNISEFWKRWHISLSSWFQDYVYIPLGGNRKGNTRTIINIFIVMLLSGLWHGAGWTYIVWGALYGIVSCVSKTTLALQKKLGKIVNTVINFMVVTLLWVVFRADSIDTAITIWFRMFMPNSGISHPYSWSFIAIFCLVIGTLVAAIYSRRKGTTDKCGNNTIKGFYPVLDLKKISNLVVFFTFLGLTIILGYYGNSAFIYGSF